MTAKTGILAPKSNSLRRKGGAEVIPMRRFGRGLRTAWRDERVRGILVVTATMVLWASAFYRYVEGWSWLDSVYFSVVTISTVGYGDFSPATDAGKLFTVFYIVIGLGIFVAAVTTIADAILTESSDKKTPKN